MEKIGLVCANSQLAYSMAEARAAVDQIGLPCVIRPGFTMGGSGGGIAYNLQEFEDICGRGLAMSLNSEILIEESIAGWKEFELEVIRDKNDNVIIVCSIGTCAPILAPTPSASPGAFCSRSRSAPTIRHLRGCCRPATTPA